MSAMNQKIHWTSEGVDLPALDYERVERWIARVAEAHGRAIGKLDYTFCDDSEILRVNLEALNHDYYTDIITFDNTCGRFLRGEIYISLDTVDSNAAGLGENYTRELLRVIIHGVLHLCGIDDKGPGEREVMEANEDAALEMYEAEGEQ